MRIFVFREPVLLIQALLVEGGVIVIYTPDVPYPWQLPPQARGELGGGYTEEEFKETIEKAKIGVKYFKDRKKIVKEYKKRLGNLSASKEPKTFREPKKIRNKN